MNHDLGLIGLAVMGKNLVLNIARNGFDIAVFNRTPEVTDEFLATDAKGKSITGYKDLKGFIASLKRPRRVMVMVKAGQPVDDFLKTLKPFLDKGDIVIDCGNSLYKDTERRHVEMSAAGILYVGMGVSGGEEGALWGPSIMPGGDKNSFEKLVPVLEKISAKSDSGPCYTFVGRGAAGHFVKMVHNGIEYGDMQLIAETYDILRKGLGLPADKIAEIFEEWNQGILKSYLIEITAKVLVYKEKAGGPFLVDQILDKAGQKGTGAWTVKAAMDEGVAIPTMTAAVDARILSSQKTERVHAASAYKAFQNISPAKMDNAFIQKLMLALYASKICSYAQGFQLMRAADKSQNYGLNMSEIARIWKGGCIIRAVFLDRIRKAYTENPSLENLLLDPGFKQDMEKSVSAWQEVLAFAIARGIAIPAMSASFAYFSTYVTAQGSANLIQAQRDFFGAHTYERTDREGIFHTHWNAGGER